MKELQPSKVSRIQIFSLQITMVINLMMCKADPSNASEAHFACQRQRHRSLESLTLRCFLPSSGERPRFFFRSITSPVRRPTPEQLTCKIDQPSPCPIYPGCKNCLRIVAHHPIELKLSQVIILTQGCLGPTFSHFSPEIGSARTPGSFSSERKPTFPRSILTNEVPIESSGIQLCCALVSKAID